MNICYEYRSVAHPSFTNRRYGEPHFYEPLQHAQMLIRYLPAYTLYFAINTVNAYAINEKSTER